MKSKKLYLPTVIFAVTILAMILFCLIYGISFKPAIKEAEFPFSITYELNGETQTIDDVYSAYFYQNGGYTNTKSRFYNGNYGTLPEGDTYYTIKDDETGSIHIIPHFYAEYMMGDQDYDYHFDIRDFAPELIYHDEMGTEFTDAETLAEQKVKIIDFEYPEPIKNTLVFSHISYPDAEVVVPCLLMSILALIATLIFVKKDEGVLRKRIDIASVIFNFLVAIAFIPVITVFAWFLDITGDNDNIFTQMFYHAPAFTVFGIMGSIVLRRKGYHKSGFFVQFIVPVIIVITFFICGVIY